MRASVENHRPLHDVRVAAERAAPEAVADHHRLRPIGSVFFGAETPPEHRRDAHGIEKLPRHLAPAHMDGPAIPNKIETAKRAEYGRNAIGIERLRVVAPINVLERFNGIAYAAFAILDSESYHSLRLRIRKRSQQHRVDNAEDGRVGADSQSQRENGNRCEAG